MINCKQSYSRSKNVTIDEKIEALKVRCQFQQYIPWKTAKYGSKIFALCDAKTLCANKVEVYCGMQTDCPF